MPTMTDSSAAIRACKERIADAVNRELTTLRTETGLSPSDIDIDMIDVTTVTSPHREYAAGDVRLRFDL